MKFRQITDDISTDILLSLKLSELPFVLSKTWLHQATKQVLCELAAKGLKIKPTFWLSTEWFCPNGYLGVAIPFYLAHPRLIELEREMVGLVEGEGEDWTLKLLRHELGHVIDNAFHLRREKERREVFGPSSLSYPLYYDHRPYSKSFVRHLEGGYAQGHPAEDFAETFAVWLDPKSNWESSYRDWPALLKLNYVEKRMSELVGLQPKITRCDPIEPISDLSITLKEHYRRKLKYLRVQDNFWSGLPKLQLVSSERQRVRNLLSEELALPKYKVDRLIKSYHIGTKESPQTATSDIAPILLKRARRFFNEQRDYSPL